MIEPWPGSGLCATWVNRLFTRIGNAPQGYLPYASSYMKWCPARLDASRLKVGMIVVVPSTVTAPGIGHIGVYMGDGIIRSSESGGVINRSVAEWTAAFCKIAPAYMGWINNRDLSAQ